MDGSAAITSEERRRIAVRKAMTVTLIAALIAMAFAASFFALAPAATEWRGSQTRDPGGFYLTLAAVHFATIAPCFLIAVWLLLRRKGTPTHKLLGKVYMVLISFSSVVAVAMPATIGPRLWNHLGFIHLFCLAVFVSVPYAVWAIRRGNVRAHAYSMRGLFLGGIVIAGAFAFSPGRLLHAWLFA